MTLCFTFGAAIGWLVAIHLDMGPKAEWFSGFATVAAVGVALWQTLSIQRQAKADAADAAKRLQDEIDAAEQRSTRELENARELHRVELEAQREIARVQRVHLREQEFKLALIRVSRAVNDYTHELATLVEQGRRVAKLTEKAEREDALLSLSKQLGSLAKDIQLEVSGARMFTRSDQLQEALNGVLAAVMHGPEAEIGFRQGVINRGQMPAPIAIFRAMEMMQQAVGAARQLAGDLLATGWD